MRRELIDAAGLHGGVRYHYAAITHPAQTTVFAAGACPLDELGAIVPANDLTGQARQALGNLKVALAAAGSTPDDVVKTTVYVASSSREDLSLAWSEVETVFGEKGPPSTLVGVTVLGYPDQLFEIEAIAVRSAD